jgi:hypothetical protein
MSLIFRIKMIRKFLFPGDFIFLDVIYGSALTLLDSLLGSSVLGVS